MPVFPLCHNISIDKCTDFLFNTTVHLLYRGADKSLARPDWKNNWKVAIFRPPRRSLLPRRPGRTFWIFFRVASKS